MARLRVRVNNRAVGRVLASDEVGDAVKAVARRVERAASAASEADGQFRTDFQQGGKRPRVAVIGDYSTRDVEVSRRALLAGLDAGEGS